MLVLWEKWKKHNVWILPSGSYGKDKMFLQESNRQSGESSTKNAVGDQGRGRGVRPQESKELPGTLGTWVGLQFTENVEQLLCERKARVKWRLALWGRNEGGLGWSDSWFPWEMLEVAKKGWILSSCARYREPWKVWRPVRNVINLRSAEPVSDLF